MIGTNLNVRCKYENTLFGYDVSEFAAVFFCDEQISGKEAWIFTNPTDHMVTEMI